MNCLTTDAQRTSFVLIQSRIDRKKTTLYVIIFAPPYLFCFFCVLNLADNLARDVRGRHQTSHVWKTGTIHLKVAPSSINGVSFDVHMSVSQTVAMATTSRKDSHCFAVSHLFASLSRVSLSKIS